MLKSGPCRTACVVRLAIVIWAVSVFIGAGGAGALGLGEIRVKSAFNKSFTAVIPVFLEKGETDLKAETGKPSDYNLLQVGRPPFIDSLSLTVEEDPARPGEKAIVVRSRDPINQPSFNLVIRAKAGGGAILENYFLAVDFRKSLSLELPKQEPQSKPEEQQPARAEKQPVPLAAAIPQEKAAPVDAPRPEPALSQATAPAPSPAVPPAPEVKPVEKPAPPPIAAVIKSEPPAAKPAEPEPSKNEEGQREPQPLPVIHADPSPGTNTIHVVKGDTLFNIARRLEPEKNDVVRVVVALYMANKEAFIRENINLIKSGTTVSYRRVNELAASVTSQQSRDILSRGWNDPSNPASGQSAVAAFEAPLQRPVSGKEAADFVERWRKHWTENSEDLEKDYSGGFLGPRGIRKKEWLAMRREFNGANDNIRITLGDLKISRRGLLIDAEFTQRLESDQLSSLGEKVLTLRTEEGELKITDERLRIIKTYDFSHVWTVSTSAAESRPVAQGIINALTARGYAAYETGGFIGEGGYQIAVGRLGVRQTAQALAEKLIAVGETGAKVVRLPFSLRVIMVENQAQASEISGQLANAGYSAFTVETLRDGKPRQIVYIGAFSRREEAEKALAALKLTGFSPQVTIP